MPRTPRVTLFSCLVARALVPFWAIAWGAANNRDAVYLGKHRLVDKNCVCDDDCGNDFCYIGVERAVLTDSGVKP